jgi:wyosine [tRNA(Phe)-imidazoG37] synthetase (radical SAM superfamily)
VSARSARHNLLRPRGALRRTAVREQEMSAADFSYVYGPVASRRLGRSLGVDLVPFKTCSYDCIYCQLGRTTCKTIERREYFPIGPMLVELEKKLAAGPAPDYITLAGSGEPTLNARIGELITAIKKLTSINVAVLTNGSLLWMPDVRQELSRADLVVPSLDAGDSQLFNDVNRPHPAIDFDAMIEGLIQFTEKFSKPVWLEVLLLSGITGVSAEVEKIAGLTRRIRPQRVQLNTVSRPPCEQFAHSLNAEQLEAFATLFEVPSEVVSDSSEHASPGESANDVSDGDVLALISRRPSTAQGVAAGLGLHVNDAIKRLRHLCKQGNAVTVRENEEVFYEGTGKATERTHPALP